MDILQSKIDFVTQDFSERKLLQMGFNILPKGRSMLHMLTKSHDEASDQVFAYQGAKDLFRVFDIPWDLNILGTEGGCTFELPLLPNM